MGSNPTVQCKPLYHLVSASVLSKVKHRHESVNLATLKYYKVDDPTGKINRLRRECPAEECGAGVFMAAHHDRQYCGKCGLTYVFQNPEDKDE